MIKYEIYHTSKKPFGTNKISLYRLVKGKLKEII